MNDSKFAITADLHLKMWNDTEFDEHGVPRKLNDTLNAFRQMCDYCRENGINSVVVAGDVGDMKNIVHTKAFVMFASILRYEYSDLAFHIIRGNHDITSKHDTASSVDLLDVSDNVFVHPAPAKILDGVYVVPWSANMIEDIKALPKDGILISHFALSEAQVSSGMNVKTNFNLGMLKKFRLVVLGDYHDPQHVGNVVYTGSPIQLNRAESKDKRFIVLDCETAEYESIPITGYRKYFTVLVENEDQLKETLKLVKQYKQNGDIVVVKSKLKTIPKTLRNAIEEGVQLLDESEDDYSLRGITSAMSLKEQCKKYMEIKEIDPKYQKGYLKVLRDALS